MVYGIVGLFAGVLFAVVLGSYIRRSWSHFDKFIISCWAVAMLCIFFACALLFYIGGAGNLAHDDNGVNKLKNNGIYETLSAVEIGKDGYAVVLRDQDGNIQAYLLNTIPPKVFKKTKGGYASFPAQSPEFCCFP